MAHVRGTLLPYWTNRKVSGWILDRLNAVFPVVQVTFFFERVLREVVYRLVFIRIAETFRNTKILN
jgi:hypothetical protein